ncbi:MAG: ACP S-malonyltransferase, partial [Elusimicrobiota bacterium]
AFANFSRNAASEKALASASNLPDPLVFSTHHKNPADRKRLIKELGKAGLKPDSVFPVLSGGGPKTDLIHIFKKTDRALPKKLSWNGKTAFLFPSTLSQYPGMGRQLKKAFPAVAENLKELDKILGYNLSYGMEGSKKLLFPGAASPRFPVHMEVVAGLSLAVAHSLSQAGIRPDAVAGYSVGEFAAASFAGVIGLRECFSMIRALALGCQKCCLASPGGLFIVYGLSRKELETVATGVGKDGHLCRIVFFSDNMRLGEVGIRQDALSALKNRLADFPHKLKRLAVAGAFHTPLFTPLARRMEKFASGMPFNRAEFPLYMNRNGFPETFPEKIKTKLSSALDHPVLWQETIERMAADGIKNFIELSPLPMLTEFICKLPAGARVMRADSPENFSKILATLLKK